MFVNISNQSVERKMFENKLKKILEKVLRTIKNVHEEICWGTFQNVPLELFKMFTNIQKVPEGVCKHFKLLSEKMFENNLQMFWISYQNCLEKSLSFLKCS